MRDDQHGDHADRPLSGPAALTHLSSQQPFTVAPDDLAGRGLAREPDESGRHRSAATDQDDEAELGFMTGVSADRKFWSDDDDGYDDGDEEPWDDLETRRGRRRIPLGLLAGGVAAGVALLAGIWSMTNGEEADPANPAVAVPSGQPILETPPPLPDTMPTGTISMPKASREPSGTPDSSVAAKPTKSSADKTSRPMPAPTITPLAKRSPTVRHSPTVKPTIRKNSVPPAGPTEAPPPPSSPQYDEPSHSGPTEAPPPPGM